MMSPRAASAATPLAAMQGVMSSRIRRRVAPLHVLLVGVLELDAERAPEERQVVLEHDRALGLVAAEIAVTAVVDAGHVGRAGGQRPIDVVEHHLMPRLRPELLFQRRRARPAPAQVGLELDHLDARDGGEEPARRHPLALPGLARAVIVQRDGGLDGLGERELAAVQAVGEKLGGVALGERQLGLEHLVVELDARRAPHDHLARRHLLEQLDRVVGVALARGLLAAAVVLDAAAIRRAAGGHVVQAEPVEDGGRRLDHVRGAEHIAAQVEDDVVALAVAGGLQEPRPLLLLGEEVVGQLDLAEVLRVVEAHGVEHLRMRPSIAEMATCPPRG